MSVSTPSTAAHSPGPDPLIAAVRDVYAELSSANLDQLRPLYHEDVVFIDPVNEIHGRENLMAHFRSIYRDVLESRFEFDPDRELIDGERAMLAWTMTYRHRRLAGKRPVEVPGASLLQFRDDSIVYHRDWFDLGAMVYEHVPLLGGVVRALKGRLEA